MQESSQLTYVMSCGFVITNVCIMRWTNRPIFVLYKCIIYMISLYERHKICLKLKLKH
jgi:hypothetical protein